MNAWPQPNRPRLTPEPPRRDDDWRAAAIAACVSVLTLGALVGLDWLLRAVWGWVS